MLNKNNIENYILYIKYKDKDIWGLMDYIDL